MSDLVLGKVPGASDYGAVELKELIRLYTYRGFGIAVGILMLLILFYYANEVITASNKPKLAPVIKTELVDLEIEQNTEAPPPPPPEMIVNTGPAVRAGTPVAIPDAEMKPDMQEFATIDVMDRASAAGGNGVDLGGFASNIDFEGSGNVKVQVREELPDPDDFIAVEKEPAVDIVAVQKLVEYPELARKAGIEGRVIVKVLVRKDGTIQKPFIEYSDNSMLDKAALSAIQKTGKIPPAIQNGQPVDCWVSIPIAFRLR